MGFSIELIDGIVQANNNTYKLAKAKDIDFDEAGTIDGAGLHENDLFIIRDVDEDISTTYNADIKNLTAGSLVTFIENNITVDDTPVDSSTSTPISSNWAFDHAEITGNSGHIPTIGTSGQFLSHDGNWATPPNDNTMGSGFTVAATTNTNPTTITEGETLTIAAGTGISTTTTADGTVTITNTVTNTDTIDMGSGFTVAADDNAYGFPTVIIESETLTIAGGTGITTDTTADGTVTITNTVTDSGNTQSTTDLSWEDPSDGNIILRNTISGEGATTQDIILNAGNNITLTRDDADNITIDAATGSGGGVDVTWNGSSINTDVTTFHFYGDTENFDVYADGNDAVIIDHHNQYTFAPDFNSGDSALNDNSIINLPTRIIGEPDDSNGNRFYTGDWKGAKNKYTSGGSDTITFSNNTLVGNIENDPKVRVTVYGPQDDTTSGDTNILGEDASGGYTFLFEIDSSSSVAQSGSGNGVTVDVGVITDGAGTSKSATISVTIDPSDTALTPTTNDGNPYTGSQKFTSVKIEHMSNDLNTTYGNIFESTSWFHDKNPLAPVAAAPELTFGSLTEMQLSNIRYYDDGRTNVRAIGYSNLFRDTSRYDADLSGNLDSDDWLKIEHQAFPGTIHGTGSQYSSLTKDDSLDLTAGSTTGDYTQEIQFPSQKWATNYKIGWKSKVINNNESSISWVNDGVFSGVTYDNTFKNYNTYSNTSTKTIESHRSELYRLSGNKEDVWKNLSTDETEDYWKRRSVGGRYGRTLNFPGDATAEVGGPYVGIDKSLVPNGTLNLSISLWIRFRSIPSEGGTNDSSFILGKSFDGGQAQFLFGIDSNDELYVGFRSGTATNNLWKSTYTNSGGRPSVISTANGGMDFRNEWVHCAVTISRDNTNDSIIDFYINGDNAHSTTWSGHSLGSYNQNLSWDWSLGG
nr:hypothetical protein [Gammaproteobacteria bacterium]